MQKTHTSLGQIDMFTQRQEEVHVEHLQNFQEGPNNAESVRGRVSQSL